MKKLLLSILLLITFLTNGQTTITAFPRVEGKNEAYLQHLPPSFKSNSGKKYPLILVFHGNGEFGNGTSGDGGLKKLYVTGLPKIIKEGNWSYKDKFIVLMYQDFATKKQCATGYDVKRFIAYAREKYKNSADLSRVYLTGYSCGGNAIYEYLALNQSSKDIAAAVPISANGSKVSRAVACNVKIPMWGIHGEKDTKETGSPVENDRNAYDEFAKCSQLNGKVKYSEYEGIAHNAWDNTYRGGYRDLIKGTNNYETIDIFKWMLKFSTSSTNTTPPPPPVEQPKNCAAPKASASNIGKTTATISWSKTDANSYNIFLTPSDGGRYQQAKNFTGTAYNITGLRSNISYTAEVFSNCGSNSASTKFTFRTKSSTSRFSDTAEEMEVQSNEISAAAIAYPNPFSTQVTFSFTVDIQSSVNILIYNTNGILVKSVVSNQIFPSGKHEINWDATQNGSRVQAGIYICRVVIDEKVQTIKLTVSK